MMIKELKRVVNNVWQHSGEIRNCGIRVVPTKMALFHATEICTIDICLSKSLESSLAEGGTYGQLGCNVFTL